MKTSRISILDGFRAMSILLVLLFHYFSRWAPPKNSVSLYPYNNDYSYFGYGYLGVQLFFIISGFVIFFTLENTKNMSLFWKNRFIRLIPSMLIASVITFGIFAFFDPSNLFPESHSVNNLIPSISFISPSLLNNIFNNSQQSFNYINGSYWSLWPEIQFYLLASVIYFLNKAHFIRNFNIVIIVLIGFNQLVTFIQLSGNNFIELPTDFLIGYTKWIKNGFNLITYLPFFSIGVLFYVLFQNNQKKISTSNYIVFTLMLLVLYIVLQGVTKTEKVFLLIMVAMFFCFVYIPNMLSFLEHQSLTKVGESSYFIYLIHENIGILIIYSIGQYFMPFGFILPFLLILCFVRLCFYYTSNIEKKIGDWLKLKIIGIKIHSKLIKMKNTFLSSNSTNQNIALVVPVLNDNLTITEEAIIQFSQKNPTVLLSFIIDAHSKKAISLLKNIQGICPENMMINIHGSFANQIDAIRQGMLFAYNHTNSKIIGFLDPNTELSFEHWLSMAKHQEYSAQFSATFGSRVSPNQKSITKNRKPASVQFANSLIKSFEKLCIKTNFQDIFCNAKTFNRHLIPFIFNEKFEDVQLFELEILLRLQQKFGRSSIQNGIANFSMERSDDAQTAFQPFQQYGLLPFKLINLYFKHSSLFETFINKLYLYLNRIQRIFSFNTKKHGLSTRLLIRVKS
ncbi:MAG: acyltransferase family protein [Sphingobacteriia bacterium]|jgi:peptidoglycan/LPS O-acetylase OafA/YrhL/translation initiation factor 2 beta subunit (eIF-2beta)/eIF-5